MELIILLLIVLLVLAALGVFNAVAWTLSGPGIVLILLILLILALTDRL